MYEFLSIKMFIVFFLNGCKIYKEYILFQSWYWLFVSSFYVFLSVLVDVYPFYQFFQRSRFLFHWFFSAEFLFSTLFFSPLIVSAPFHLLSLDLFYSFKKKKVRLVLARWWLLYNVSAIHEHESAMRIRMFPASWTFLPSPRFLR